MHLFVWLSIWWLLWNFPSFPPIPGNRPGQQLFRIVESTSFLSGWGKLTSAVVEIVLFDQSYFSACGHHYRNLRKTVFKERAYSASGQLIFWLVEIIFFHFLRHQWTVASGSTFPLNGTQFYELIFKWTTDFLASGKHFYCPFF